MSTDLTTVSPSTTVAEAATLMASRHIGSAIVCQDEELVGIFTERDIVKALSQDFDAPSEPIEHWMTRQPTTVEGLLPQRDGAFRRFATCARCATIGADTAPGDGLARPCV